MAEASTVKKRSKFKLLTTIAGVVILVPVAAAGVFIATFDPEQYRPEIGKFLSEKLDRTVALNGPMRLKIAGGLALEVNDVVVSNPAWASRADMLKVGQMSLSVALGPLLSSTPRLEVGKVVLTDADLQMETGPNGAKNWEFGKGPTVAEKKAGLPSDPDKMVEDRVADAAPAQNKPPLDLSLEQLLVKNVRFAMVDNKKPGMEMRIKEMSLKAQERTALQFEGVFNQQPVTVGLEGGLLKDFLLEKPWPFKMTAKYLGNDFSGDGVVTLKNNKVSKAEIGPFKLVTAIGSTATGAVTADLAGDKPRVSGKVHVDAVNVPDGAAAPAAAAKGDGEAGAQSSGRMFSDEKFDLSGLQAANADVAVTIERIVKGAFVIENISLPVKLSGGVLNVNPIKMTLGGNPLGGALQVKAAPAALALDFKGEEMNLQPLLGQMGFADMSIGRTTFAADLRSSGDSPRLLADNLNGTLGLKMGSSVISSDKLGPVLTNVMRLLSPGATLKSQNTLNCVTARFNANNGVLNSNGILMDSSLVTVAGRGAVNLRQEALNFTFQPQTKDSALNAVSAPLLVSGPLKAPSFTIDAAGTVTNVATDLLGVKGLAGVINKDALKVPLVQAGPDACTAALDNPVYPKGEAGQSSVVGTAVNAGKQELQKKIKDGLGDVLGGDKSPLKGLFGR